jgi:hypothetical protein
VIRVDDEAEGIANEEEEKPSLYMVLERIWLSVPQQSTSRFKIVHSDSTLL